MPSASIQRHAGPAQAGVAISTASSITQLRMLRSLALLSLPGQQPWRVLRTAPQKLATERAFGAASEAVVHIELDGMRSLLQARHIFSLEINVGVDEIVAEHVALLQELAIGIE